MLRVLISSQPAHESWLGGTVFSAVTHGALIGLAVAATMHNGTRVQEQRAMAPVQHVTYIDPTRLLLNEAEKFAATAKASRTKAAREKGEHGGLRLTFTDVSSAVQSMLAALPLPDPAAPDLTAVTDGWVDAADSLSAGVGGSGGADIASRLLARGTVQGPPANGIYTEEMVERRVQPRNGNPIPRYPGMLQDMGIEGDFLVKYVVDSTGKVEDDKIEFPSSMHRLFADAVRNALRRSRYFPATFGGQAVPQLVIQEFRFTMGDRRRW